MKLNRIRIIGASLLLLAAVQLNAQNSNVVSAAIEYKKYPSAFYQGQFDEAKKILLEAKKYIDPAMEHEDTKADEKAHYYNAVINFGLAELSGMEGNEDLKEFQSEETMQEIKKSLKIAYESRKFKKDVEDFVGEKVGMAMNYGKMMFENKNYAGAFMAFAGAYELEGMLGKENEEMKTNAIISAKNEVAKLKNEGKTEEALKFIESVLEQFPKNTDLAIEGVNISLDQGNLDRAESFFNKAAENDPQNKLLFSSMGSIYLSNADKSYEKLDSMKVTDPSYPELAARVEEMYSKAEKNLKRAIEIDPQYKDAAYNLGVLYLSRGEKLAKKARQMDLEDPNYSATLEKSEEMYKKAIDPLEIFIAQEPNNAGVLNVLFQVHKRAGNTEKAIEYKKRADAAAAGGE
ncbi:MAG: tetratricopeptide repeat protein [Brumimicrobium sp.]|nr:tetratricopeptide repeat protein [Brumimicrobium sp.]